MSIYSVIPKLSKNSNSNVPVYFSYFDSPVGKGVAAADDNYLYIIAFEDTKNFTKKFEALSSELKCKFVEDKNEVLKKFEQELSEYFEGKLKNFTVPTKFLGSDFQKEVWEKLVEIPYGTTQTYGDLAKALGRPASHSRAVGAACGANSLFLVVPCHRLVAFSSLGGYNSGVDRKDKLIQHEKKCS